MTNATYSESVDLTVAPSANFNRASAGYTDDILLAMVAEVAPGFYCYPGTDMSRTTIGNRDNHLPCHAERLEVAATVLRSYGLKVRRSRRDGTTVSLTVQGPKAGGVAGRYSR